MNYILKSFIKYVSLNIFSMIAFSICIFIDAYFISKAMGADGLTALNLAVPVYATINGIGLMLGVGGGANYGRLKAQKKIEEGNRVFTTVLIIGLIVAGICMLIGFLFSTSIASFLGAEGYILSMTSIYVRTILTLAPGILLSNAFGGLIRNDGAPRIEMMGSVIFSVMNIVFDYIFLFILDLGMLGVALATSFASALNLLFLLSYWWGGKATFQYIKTKLKPKQIKEICIMGLPSLIAELSVGIITMVFNLVFLNLNGNMGVAAFGIVTNLSLVAISIFAGLGQGMQPLVSVYYGKGNRQELKKVLSYSLWTVIALSVVIYTIFFGFTDKLIDIFNHENDRALAQVAAQGVNLYFSGFLFVGFNVVMITFLSVTVAPKIAFILSILRGGVIIIPLVLLMVNIFGITGVWLSYPISEIITFIIGLVCWRRIKNIYFNS